MHALKTGRIVVRLIILLAVVGLLAGGAVMARSHRKQSAARNALQAGKDAYAAKRYTQAADDLGRYLTIDPRNVEVLLLYADAQMHRRPISKGTVGQAINALELILRDEPGNRTAAERLLEVYAFVGSKPDSERVARAWLNAAGNDTSAKSKANQHLAAALLAQQKVNEADKVIQAWLTSTPDDTAGLQAKYDLLVAENKLDDAIATLKQTLQKHPSETGVVARLASVLVVEKKDWPGAEKVLNDLLVSNPDSVEARLVRARYYTMSSPPEALQVIYRTKALDDLKEVERLAGDKVPMLLEVATLYSSMGLTEKATSVLDRAEKAEPANINTYHLYTQVVLVAGDTTVSAALADRILAAPLGEERIELLPEVVELYASARKLPEARKAIEAFRAADPGPDVLTYLEGMTTMAEGKAAEGIAKLKEAVHRSPKLARAQLMLGRALLRSGDPRGAVEPLKAFVDSAQANPQSGMLLSAQLELAQAYAQSGSWDAAAALAKEMNTTMPNIKLASVAALSGWELQGQAARHARPRRDLAKLKELQTELDKKAKEHPTVWQLHLLRARFRAWQGNVDEAAEIIKSAGTEQGNKLATAVALTDIYADAERYDQAAKECQSAIELTEKAKQPALRLHLSELQAQGGDFAGARKTLEEIATTAPGAERLSARYQLARLLINNKQSEEARPKLLQLVGEDPRNLQARILLLSLGAAKGQKPTQQELVDQVKTIEGVKGQNWRYWQAVVWLTQDDWATHAGEVEAILKECLVEDPNWDAGVLALGAWYEKSGQSDKALELYDRQFNRHRDSMDIARRLLTLSTRGQQWSTVERVLDALQVENKSPAESAWIQQFRLMLALHKGETGEAGQILEDRVLADPKDFASFVQLGNLSLSRNDVAEAERRLAQAAQIAPDALEVLFARARLHTAKREYEQALQLCEQIITKQPDAAAYQLRASVQESKGDLEAAVADLRRITQLQDTTERGYLLIGQLYFRHYQRDKAMEAWREGITKVEKSYLLRPALADAMMVSKDSAQRQGGLAMVEESLKDYPGDDTLLLMRAGYLARNKPEEAEKAYEKILEDHPGLVGAYRGLAALARNRDEPDIALRLIDRGLNSNPRDVDLLLLRADLLMKSSPERALVSAQEAFRIQPTNVWGNMLVAVAMARLGRVDAGMKVIQDLLKQTNVGPSVDALLLLASLNIEKRDFAAADKLIVEANSTSPDSDGVVKARLFWHRQQGQWDLVLALANDRIKQNREDLEPARYAGQLLLESDQLRWREEGVKLFQRLLEIKPEEATSWRDLGLAFYLTGKPAETRKAYERAAQLDPDDVRVINDLAWIICEDFKDPQGALAWGQKAFGAKPEDQHVLDTWGVLQFRLGNLEKSQESLRKCLASRKIEDPTRFSATVHLARTLAANNAEESCRLLTSILGDRRVANLLSAESLKEAQALMAKVCPNTKPAP